MLSETRFFALAARYILELWGTIVQSLSSITAKSQSFTLANILPPDSMRISGIEKFSLLDYPGKISCVVFTPGCNLRCGYCHNPEFVLPEKLKNLRDSFRNVGEFFEFLKTRIGMLDGVSICGGEPTLQAGLIDFCRDVKSLGFSVKLDTNGRDPALLKDLLQAGFVDYVAMDIKHTWNKYDTVTGKKESVAPYKKSVKIIIKHASEYEFRTTVIGGIHSENDIEDIARSINGAKSYYLQSYRPGRTLDSNFPGYSPEHTFLESSRKNAELYVEKCEVRT